MRLAFRSLLLFAAITALVAAGGLSTAALQDKKDKDKKAAEEVGTVEVFKAKDGWRYRVKNAEGKALVGSYVGHEKKEDCLKELDTLKATLSKAKVTEIKEEKEKKDK